MKMTQKRFERIFNEQYTVVCTEKRVAKEMGEPEGKLNEVQTTILKVLPIMVENYNFSVTEALDSIGKYMRAMEKKHCFRRVK